VWELYIFDWLCGWAGPRGDVLCSTIGTGVRALGALAASERAIRRMLIGGLFVDGNAPFPPIPHFHFRRGPLAAGLGMLGVRSMFHKTPWGWEISLHMFNLVGEP